MLGADFQKLVCQLAFGKRLPSAVYIHRDGIPQTSPAIQQFLSQLIEAYHIGPEYNLIKFHTDAAKITFLEYPEYFENPHPSLTKSKIVDLISGRSRDTDYSKNANPPILHRKETFLPANHPRVAEFSDLTMQEESAGLYQNTSTIGFKLNWRRLLEDKGLGYSGHKLVASSCPKAPVTVVPIVDRHKTALARYDLSKPVKTLFENCLLRPDTTVFDYGCGPGSDVAGLVSLGYRAFGWDPAFKPSEIKRPAEIVNLGYVINVIEDPAERVDTLAEAWSYTQKLLVVSGLIRETVRADTATAFGDGVITNRNTFQKFFEQHELQSFIEDALEQTAIPVALGIFYVFREPFDLQRFLVSRTKRVIAWEDLAIRVNLGTPTRRESCFEQNRELLEDFFRCTMQLGRLPLPDEYSRYSDLHDRVGSTKRALRLLLADGRTEAFAKAQDSRKADTLVYLAVSNLRRQVPFKHQPPSIRADIKAFFGDYKRGLRAGLDLLFASGDSDELIIACEGLKIGWQDEQALYFHVTLLRELPPILRAYVACVETLYGDATQSDLIKLHKSSGKVTFLQYDDFVGKALPELRQRVKVNLRTRWVQVFDHARDEQVLCFKERFVSPSDPQRASMQQTSEIVKKLGHFADHFIGPTKSELIKLINGRTELLRELGLG